MKYDYEWLHGPALELLLKFGGVRPGDVVKVSGAWPYGESRVVVVFRVSSWLENRWFTTWVSTTQVSVPFSNIRAWCRPPLDLEL